MGQMPQMREVMPASRNRDGPRKFLKAADLGHLELGVGHLAGIVQLNGDLGVALNAAYRSS